MTQEEKRLLIKDLSARLPYVPQIVHNGITEALSTLHIFDMTHIRDEYVDIKPYLRPMSSMTEDEESKYNLIQGLLHWTVEDGMIQNYGDAIDFLNEHHFDYRGLIPMGLALEAPEGMYKTE